MNIPKWAEKQVLFLDTGDVCYISSTNWCFIDGHGSVDSGEWNEVYRTAEEYLAAMKTLSHNIEITTVNVLLENE